MSGLLWEIIFYLLWKGTWRKSTKYKFKLNVSVAFSVFHTCSPGSNICMTTLRKFARNYSSVLVKAVQDPSPTPKNLEKQTILQGHPFSWEFCTVFRVFLGGSEATSAACFYNALCQNFQNPLSKMIKSGKNGLKWSNMVQYGPILSNIVQFSLKCCKIVWNCPKLSKIVIFSLKIVQKCSKLSK